MKYLVWICFLSAGAAQADQRFFCQSAKDPEETAIVHYTPSGQVFALIHLSMDKADDWERWNLPLVEQKKGIYTFTDMSYTVELKKREGSAYNVVMIPVCNGSTCVPRACHEIE